MPSFFGGSARRGSETGARSSVVSSSSSRRSLWEREVDPSDSVSQASGPRSSHRSHSSRHFQASDYSRALSSRHNMSSSRMSDARTVAPSNYTSSRMSSSSRRDPARLSRPGDAPDLQRADLMWRRSSCETSVSGVPYMGSAGAVAPYSPGMYNIQEVPSTGYPSVVSSSTQATSRAAASRMSGMSRSRTSTALDSYGGSRGSAMPSSSRRRCTCRRGCSACCRGCSACCRGSRNSAPVPFVGQTTTPSGTYVYAGYRID